MKNQEETNDVQKLRERLDRNEHLSWLLKELEEMLSFRNTAINKIILILRECREKDEQIRAELMKHFLLEEEQINEKLK